MVNSKKLTAGFTGTVNEEAGGVASRAKETARSIRREASTAVAAADDHRALTSTALLVAGLIGLTLGYALGASSNARRQKRLRWFSA